jgi:tetratricopeptide (TPR) repeat protein
MSSVEAKREAKVIPTYGLGAPEKNPLFFEKRVYQGSCGKVYPVPFIDRVFDVPKDQAYDSVRLENEYVRLVMLPEIGGRIFLGQDKVNHDYDFFYRQDVIKPALVGLAGPWISGGVEFNWPQHHRPGTYMPADVHIEECADGSGTVWMSEHDPINRLKGMHGIRIQPDSALVELKARLYNRTPFTQTFLWWANVAAEVHDNYQSFFPPDVHYVADHAVRAQSSFPVADNDYYGVEYANRPDANDLSWYKNIPVPTSYMVCDTQFNFFGGYDYDAQGGFIHVANKHVSPGKKQWTWGNEEFGWAWDRELTDRIGPTGRPAPYVELMAGVYTDNQPDFSYLMPYETKTFSQYWWPYKKIGPVQNATKDAAVRLVQNDDGTLDLGAVVSRKFEGARIVLRDNDTLLIDDTVDLCPDSPWHQPAFAYEGDDFYGLEISVEGLVAYRPVKVNELERDREVATEPPMPNEIATIDELYLTAEHLEQYRHPTRYPEIYWDAILRRDPMDARTNIAYGRRKLNQGLLGEAAACFETAIKRLTRRHPNPCSGEAHYYLGLTLRFQNRLTEAYAAFYKSTWNYQWRAAAYYELAMLDCRKGDFPEALEHCEASLDTNRQNNKARVLKAIALKRVGKDATAELSALLAIDSLDHWARYESGDIEGFLEKSRNDAQTVLDIAYDYADAGCVEEAAGVLELHHAHECTPTAVPNPLARSQLTHYALAWLRKDAALLNEAREMTPEYLFPSRIHDQIVLEWAVNQDGADRNAAFGLGNYFFDRKRHECAIRCWETAREADPGFSTAVRNLGIAYWNVRRDGKAARYAYFEAVERDPTDARIFAEYDQLRARLGDPAEDRLADLMRKPELVAERDDCSVALAELFNATGQSEKALDLLRNRRFHPWEGGEGKVLRQYTTAHLLLGKKALGAGAAEQALEHFEQAMQPPQNLGEAYHLLQAKADVSYWTGQALRALGRETEAVSQFDASANEAGDFQAMAVTEHSELSYYRGLSLMELGRTAEAEAMFADLKAFAEGELKKPATIDYFATSLPLLLVFEDDLNKALQAEMENLMQLANKGLMEMGVCK